jgi:hypothetical protein
MGASPVTDVFLVGYQNDEVSSEPKVCVVFRASGTWCSLGVDGNDVVGYNLPEWLAGLLSERLESSEVELQEMPMSRPVPVEEEAQHAPQFVTRPTVP